MILPGMGVVSEMITCFFPQTNFRLSLGRLFEHGDRRAWISGLGTSHVCLQPVDLCRNGFLDPEFSGGRSFRHQGLQLDSYFAQGLDSFYDADALRFWLYWICLSSAA